MTNRLVLALALAAPLSGAAQAPRVNLAVTLAPPSDPTGVRRARVQVRDLFRDQHWITALDQALPIRLHFELEIWRSRQGWVDDYQRTAEWSILIQRDLLEDQYRVTRILRSGPEQFIFATRDSLARWMSGINEVDALPQGVGTFYYHVNVEIQTLTDQEMEELERFMAGNPEPAPPQQRGSLGRTLRRIILRLGGAPFEQLDARSDQFVVVRRRQD